MKLRVAAPATAHKARQRERESAHDAREPASQAQHPLRAQGAAGPQAAASKAPRQPLRVLSKAGRKGGVAAALPGHPGVPDQHEQNVAATHSHELSLLRVASTHDIPWQQRHEPLRVERSARVRTDLRRDDTPVGGAATLPRTRRRR